MNRVFYAVLSFDCLLLSKAAWQDKLSRTKLLIAVVARNTISPWHRLPDFAGWITFLLTVCHEFFSSESSTNKSMYIFLLLSTAFLKAAVSNLLFLAINLLQHWLQRRLSKRKPLCQDKNTAIITPLQACNQTETAQTLTDRPSVDHRAFPQMTDWRTGHLRVMGPGSGRERPWVS